MSYIERASRYPSAQPTRTGAAPKRKIASTSVTLTRAMVLLVVRSLEIICPKKKRLVPW